MKQSDRVKFLMAEIARLEAWVSDLQDGCWVNCVYCGHRYGHEKNTPVSMADVLKEHIEQCPKHPLKAALDRVRELENHFVRWASGSVNDRARLVGVFGRMGMDIEAARHKAKRG